MVSTTLKWVTGGMEIFLGIPFIGGAIVFGFGYVPLLVMLALHIITLVYCVKEGSNKTGSILGIVTSCIPWIPFYGMLMHITTGILLMFSANKIKEDV